MPSQSAGILLYRHFQNEWQFFLVHPGGPFWKNKDQGAWSIPKGEFNEGEDPLLAAKREFLEETGSMIDGAFIPLHPIRQKNGKRVMAWALAGNIDPLTVRSNKFEMEWPPHSGKMQSFPEVDRADWFNAETAKLKIIAAQIPLIDELLTSI